jgi:hypothetical protein
MKIPFRISLTALVLFGALVISQVAATDPCTLERNQGSNWVGPVANLRACFDNIPFSKDRATATVHVMKQLTQLYSFTDIAKDSGAPYNMKIDLEGTLDKISSKISNGDYKGDYAFEADLIRLFTPLNDAHTFYGAPYLYRSCLAIRPFALHAVNDNGKMRVFTTQGVFPSSIFEKHLQFNASAYYGKEISVVNGKDVLSYLRDYADKYVGYYKDQSVRVNALLQQQGWPLVEAFRFPFSDELDADSIVFADKPNEIVQVPNLGLAQGGIKSTDYFVQQIDGARADMATGNAAAVRKFFFTPDIRREVVVRLENTIGSAIPPKHVPAHLSRFKPARTHSLNKRSVTKTVEVNADIGNPQNIKTIAAESSWGGEPSIYHFEYTLKDGSVVPVLKITSFAPSNQNSWQSVLTGFAKSLKTKNSKRAVIDVAKNGGGIICLAIAAQATLVKEWAGGAPGTNPNATVWQPYDLRKTAMNDGLTKVGFNSPQEYYNMYTGRVYKDSTWYDDSVTRTRGGVTGQFSSQVYFPAECDSYLSPTKNIDYFVDDLTIITDGTCGSACSLFITKFQSHNKAKILSYGGIEGMEEMETSSFAGGNVLDWASFVGWLRQFPSFPDQPKSLPGSGFARFNHHEVYPSVTAQKPREFHRFPANFHMFWWDAVSDDQPQTTDGSPNPQGLKALATLYETAGQLKN